jgi:hypothetical protein
VELDRDDVAALRDAAAAVAGQSSAARDLSLVLDRALMQAEPVALRRVELRTLAQIAARTNLGEIVRLLSEAS